MTFQDNGGQEPTISDTGQGHLVGVQPAQPRLAGNWAQERPDQAVSQQQPIAYIQQQPTNGPQPRWTDEDLNEARRLEKDKLYGRIEELGAQLTTMQEERAAEQAERERIAAEAAEALRAKEEDELGVRDLLARRETEFQTQLSALEQRYDADRAIFEKERAYGELQEYRRNRIAQEAEFIDPALRDLVSGESPEAIDASIASMRARTDQIWANVAAQSQNVPPPPRGAAPTAPPVGPMEQMPAYESLTPEDIKGMDMETYKRYRNTLLAATNPRGQRRQ